MQGDANFFCSFYVSRGFCGKCRGLCDALPGSVSRVLWCVKSFQDCRLAGAWTYRYVGGTRESWGVPPRLGTREPRPLPQGTRPPLLLYPYALAIALGPTPRDHRAVNFLLHGRKKFSRFSGRVKITSARNHCAFRRGTVAAMCRIEPQRHQPRSDAQPTRYVLIPL